LFWRRVQVQNFQHLRVISPYRILSRVEPIIAFWIHREESVEIIGGPEEGIGAGPNEECGPANLVVLNSEPERNTPFRPRGFWVDWEGTLSSGTNDYVFAPNHTTYISGQVNLSNTNYLMGGTVLKFAPTNNAGLSILGQLVCQTGPYEMAVLTARDDHSVGSPVGTNALSGHYAEVAVQIPGYPSSELSYVRIAHAKQAIHYSYSMYGTTHNVNHSQFVNCGVGFYPLNVTVLLRNCLLSRVRTNFFGSQYYPSSVRGEQLTVAETTRLNDNSYLTLYLTNALLANVTNNGTGYPIS